jgi:hypothetical protein
VLSARRASGIPTPIATLSLTVRCLSAAVGASKELVGVGLSKELVELVVGIGTMSGVGCAVTVAVTVGVEDSTEDNPVLVAAAEDAAAEDAAADDAAAEDAELNVDVG